MLWHAVGSPVRGASVAHVVRIVQQAPVPGSPPLFEAFYGVWRWCERKSHNITASPAGVTPGAVQFEPLYEDGGSDDTWLSYVAPSSGATYRIHKSSGLHFFTSVAAIINTEFRDAEPVNTAKNLSAGSPDTNIYYLSLSHMVEITENLANALTDQITSNSGDNTEVITLFGDTFESQIYIRVRWGWLVPLLIASLATVALLAQSVILTANQPLLKTSVIAFLASSPKQNNNSQPKEEEWNTKMELVEWLEYTTSGMMVTLETDSQGNPKFVRSISDC